ncbi:hypothetical protein F5Y15DRAFT_297117 [Xylariaceae sp. FL0016]|nr:hypothetical protein F5Y15DRAFT_297117 [Xylariaceae sp. FL0016]
MSFGYSVGDIIALSGLALRIREAFKEAPKEYQEIDDAAKNLSAVLHQTGVEVIDLELDDDQHSKLDGILKDCDRVLNELWAKLDASKEVKTEQSSARKKMKRLWERLRWSPDDICKYRTRIILSCELLNSFLAAISRRSLASHVTKLVNKQEDGECRKILDWLTPADYAAQQADYIGRREPGTGEWLLQSSEYRTWVATKGSTRFCPGIPGAGKTIQASVVIQDLLTEFKDDGDVAVGYIYCNFGRREDQQVIHIISSLLKQLAQSRLELPKVLRDLYESHDKTKTRPSTEEIYKALQETASLYSRVFIVIDALDECDTANQCRTQVIQEIEALCQFHHANFLGTSRYIPEIMDRFDRSTWLEIRAVEEDVRSYVTSHTSHLPLVVQRNDALQKEVVDVISRSVDGMFLLAPLYLDFLEDKRTKKSLQNALDELREQGRPSSEAGKLEVLMNTYESAMERINSQKRGLKELAMLVLMWISSAKRTLQVIELQHALAVEADTTELDEDNIYPVEDMVSVCAGLVTVDENTGIIRLIHYTTAEYFEQTQQRWFPNGDLRITETCMTYLSFDAFSNGSVCQAPTWGLRDPESEFQIRLQRNPFFNYAASCWGYHASHVSTCQAIRDFLRKPLHLDAAFQALRLPSRPSWGLYTPAQQATGLHLAAFFGLLPLAKVMIDEESVPIDSGSYTITSALMTAAMYGQEQIVRLLLDKGANLENRDKYGNTSLSIAAKHGQEQIVRLLLDKGANLENRDEYGKTLLSIAAMFGKEQTVRLLLDKGANLENRDKYGDTPLSIAQCLGTNRSYGYFWIKGQTEKTEINMATLHY